MFQNILKAHTNTFAYCHNPSSHMSGNIAFNYQCLLLLSNYAGLITHLGSKHVVWETLLYVNYISNLLSKSK